MDVVQNVPGHKTILRAVLRHQIQLLVEQLSEYTDEETVVLSANLSDGTSFHLGSKTAKIFLDKEKDIMSRFLGFCLDSSNDSVAFRSNDPALSINKVQIMKDRLPESRSKILSGTEQIKSQKTATDDENKDMHMKKESQSIALDLNSPHSMIESCVDSKIETAESEENEYMDFSVFKTDDEVDKDNNPSVEAVLNLSNGKLDCTDIKDEKWTELPKLSTDQEADTPSFTEQNNSKSEIELGNQEVPELNIKDNKVCRTKSSEIKEGRRANISFKMENFDQDQSSVSDQTGVTPVFRVQSHNNSIIRIQKVKNSTTVKRPSEVQNVNSTKLQHICDQCGKRFSSRYRLKSHVNSKHKHVFRFTCEKCGKGFQALWNLRNHVKAHDKEQREKCSHCPKTYAHRASLISHEKTHMEFMSRPVSVCDICGIDCKDEKSRKEHKHAFHGGKTYACTVCLKTFRWRSSLAYHVKHAKHK